MRWRGGRSIEARIQWLVVICVIPGWLLLVAFTLLNYQRERESQQAHACSTARTLANALEAELDGHVVALQALATSPVLDGPDLTAFHRQARLALPPLQGESLVLTDPAGQQVANLLVPLGAPLPPLKPGVFPAGADPHAPMVSDLFLGSVTQRQQVAVHVPVLRGGLLRYRLTLILSAERLGNFLQRQNLPEGWISSVLDRNGISIARTINPERFVGKPVTQELLDKVLAHNESCFVTTSREGVRVFASHARVARYGWSTTLGVPEAAVTAEFRERLVSFTGVAVLVLLAGLWLGSLLGRRIAGPIRALVEPALAIGSGQRVDIPAPEVEEARQLADALRQAQALLLQRGQARDRAEAALHQSESMLRRALDVGQLGAWELDLGSDTVRHSLQHDRCYGYPEGVPTWTMADFRNAIHPEDRKEVLRTAERARRSGEPVHLEHRILWPDGSVHWLASHSQLVPGDEGPPRWAGVIADITERKRAEELRLRGVALEAENRQMQHANRMKREFLANMSHELRTPLNAIVGFAELLRSAELPADSPRRAEYLAHIAAGGRHLLQLVNDLLDLSRVEAGKLDFHPAPIDLPALVDETLALVRAEAERKHVALRTELQSLDGLRLDPGRLKQVLLNYLSNAIKFTPEGGRVIVRAGALGPERWRLEVDDNGIGISEADQDRLFVQFEQLRTGTARPHGGAGLGLALTRQLVEMQGGSVGVISQPGRGSVFFAVLPRVAGLPEKPVEDAALK